jgi:hypothetical protein
VQEIKHACMETTTTAVYTKNTYNNDYLLKTEKKINNDGWHRVTKQPTA